MELLSTLIKVGPYHRRTLEFVLASPIVMAFSSCLSFIENDLDIWTTLYNFLYTIIDWKQGGPEVAQSGKRMMQALISEGFEDTLEQILMRDKGGYSGNGVVEYCCYISKFLGSNVKKQ